MGDADLHTAAQALLDEMTEVIEQRIGPSSGADPIPLEDGEAESLIIDWFQTLRAALAATTEPPPRLNAGERMTVAALLERVDAWVDSVDGTPAPWALVGDMADFLRILADGSTPIPQGTDEWITPDEVDAEGNVTFTGEHAGERAAAWLMTPDAIGAPDEPTDDDDLTELRRHAQVLAEQQWRQTGYGPAARHRVAVKAACDALPGLLAEVERLRAAALFVPGEFVAHSGDTLRWKIECDGLTDRDWEALALAAVDVLPPFGGVEGVPTGGDPFAQALAAHSTPGGPLLIADDVCTTGASLEVHRAGRDAIGVVAFARGPVPSWVTPLFTLRAAVPASEDDEAKRTRLARERLVSAIDAHVAKTHEPLAEGIDPATSAALFSEDSVELLLKAAELLRAGSPPPTPAPTRERVRQFLAPYINDVLLDSVTDGVIEMALEDTP